MIGTVVTSEFINYNNLELMVNEMEEDNQEVQSSSPVQECCVNCRKLEWHCKVGGCDKYKK